MYWCQLFHPKTYIPLVLQSGPQFPHIPVVRFVRHQNLSWSSSVHTSFIIPEGAVKGKIQALFGSGPLTVWQVVAENEQ